jgi:ATP-dependent DNA helicase RecQ
MPLPYHAGLSMETREANQRRFTRDDGVIVVATVAFGMGIDKPDVRFVAHLDMPQSVEHFYQESGRAGRDGLPAASWLCYGLNDWVILRERIQQGASEEMQKNIELQKLDAMLGVCETADCRRVMLLQHFGETSAPCGHCDNCLHPPVRFDGTVLVQKLLSCVYRVGQRFAAGYVINVLRGKGDDWMARNGHDKLSTFGIGDALGDKEWRGVIRQCIGLGLLNVNVTLHQSLQLTEAAKAVLKGSQAVWLRPLKREKAATQKPKEEWLRTEREERLWQALRSWRMEKARAEEVPAYVICGDKTLRDVVEKMPQTPADLHHIYGLGEAKINKFGQEILAVCQGERPSEAAPAGAEPSSERARSLETALKRLARTAGAKRRHKHRQNFQRRQPARYGGKHPRHRAGFARHLRLGRRAHSKIRCRHSGRVRPVFRRPQPCRRTAPPKNAHLIAMVPPNRRCRKPRRLPSAQQNHLARHCRQAAANLSRPARHPRHG